MRSWYWSSFPCSHTLVSCVGGELAGRCELTSLYLSCWFPSKVVLPSSYNSVSHVVGGFNLWKEWCVLISFYLSSLCVHQSCFPCVVTFLSPVWEVDWQNHWKGYVSSRPQFGAKSPKIINSLYLNTIGVTVPNCCCQTPGDLCPSLMSIY